jgi:cytochrome P450 family 110
LESGANAFLRPFLGEHSIFVLEDVEHDTHRRIIASAFSTDGEQHKLITRECTLRLLSNLSCERSLFAFMEDLASEISIRYIFRDISNEELSSLQRWLRDGSDAASSAMPFLPMLMASFGARSPGHRLHAAITNVRNYVRSQVDIRLRKTASHSDFLSRYLEVASSAALPFDDICDDIVTLLITGYTSTAAAMSWTFYYICRSEGLREAVLADCARNTAPESCKLLQACCKESLRLWPPVPVIIRRTRTKFRILDLEVPENTYLIATVIMTHRRPDTFPRPDSYEPQRFLDRQYSPFEYLPFGSGLRRCIGQMQAQQEMLAALPFALQQSTVAGAASKPTKRHIMFVPPPNVRIKPRPG